MIFTYLLKSEKDGNYYTGIAKDPEDRLKTHNKDMASSTKSRGPWKLVYKKEHPTYKDARKHEKWLKKKNHEYKNKLAGYNNLGKRVVIV